ncbi:MAG: YciI family protein [Burkholderiaceae bacterium]|nr:YciI family protein [Burkholderiaceae bacterium]
MNPLNAFLACTLALTLLPPAAAQPAPAPAAAGAGAAGAGAAGHDAALAQRLGADDYGMRPYVAVLLKTGPTPLPPGAQRDEMFRGHFANMKRLADAGKLVLAGPYDGVDGWRGLFVFAVRDIDEARQLAAGDPVLQQGEMVAEYHRWYGSAAVMLIPELHERLAKKRF